MDGASCPQEDGVACDAPNRAWFILRHIRSSRGRAEEFILMFRSSAYADRSAAKDSSSATYSLNENVSVLSVKPFVLAMGCS